MNRRRPESRRPTAPETGSPGSKPEKTRAGGPLARMERAFGADLSGVRITSGAPGARAAAHGDEIAFASGEWRPGTLSGDLLLAHEVAHVLQQRGEGGAVAPELAEREADRAAVRAMLRLEEGAGPLASEGLSSGGLALRRCITPDWQEALDGKRPFTAKLAREALDDFRGLSESEKQQAFARVYPSGAWKRLLDALPKSDAAGAYNEVVQDVLRRVQRKKALETAQSLGLADEGAMAQAQAQHMHAENLKKAKAATGKAAPSKAEVAEAHKEQVEDTSIADGSSSMTPAQERQANKEALEAADKVIAYAKKKHPELKLVKDDFHADAKGIENRGAGVLAYGQKIKGRHVCVIGKTFTKYVNADPGYAMGVVVHELKGHPEYGPYGAPGSEYGLELYDKAAKRMSSYTKPSADERKKEIDAYAYQETEIYSLARSISYNKKLAKKDAALSADYYDPVNWLQARIGTIKRQWESRVARALVSALYNRLKLDPRIDASALAAYEAGVKKHFSSAEAKHILR